MSYFTSKSILETRYIKFYNKLESSPNQIQVYSWYNLWNACFIVVCLQMSQTLHEDSKKINIVDRLSKHLNQGTPKDALSSYLSLIRKWVPKEPDIHIDDSDVVKPGGYKFESLGIVRDGSESTKNKNVYKKGYHVTEATVLTKSGHPASIFSEIHSSKEKEFTSINDITFSAMKRVQICLEKLLLSWTEAMTITRCS